MRHKIPVFGALVLFALVFTLTVWAQQPPQGSSLQLPIFVNFDNGAPGWVNLYGTTLSENYRFGSSGMGWGVTWGAADLKWDAQIDLTTAIAPRIRFANYKADPMLTAFLFIKLEDNSEAWIHIKPSFGVWSETTLDLTPYRGHLIRLRWIVLKSGPNPWMIDNVVVDDASPPMTLVPTLVLPTLTAIPPTFPPIVPVPATSTLPPTLIVPTSTSMMPTSTLPPEATATLSTATTVP